MNHTTKPQDHRCQPPTARPVQGGRSHARSSAMQLGPAAERRQLSLPSHHTSAESRKIIDIPPALSRALVHSIQNGRQSLSDLIGVRSTDAADGAVHRLRDKPRLTFNVHQFWPAVVLCVGCRAGHQSDSVDSTINAFGRAIECCRRNP